MLLNPTSPDILSLSANVIWDISGNVPTIKIVNTSTGTGLNNVTWWFVATSPSQTLIYAGTEQQPTITGTWTTYNITSAWPRPGNNIEFSGSPYELTMYAKDSAGSVYTYRFSPAYICRPFGNTKSSTNPYGVASVDVQVKCDMGRVFFQNTTNISYQGLNGTMDASTLKMLYPLDETNTLPKPFSIDYFSTALVPITYSSDNYQFVTQQYYTYELSPGTSVKIRYQLQKRFPVYCNVNLLPLVCEYQKLIDELETGNCTNSAEASQKLMLINSKMALVTIGINQPLTGIDVPYVIKQIEAIGGFECNCCSASSGIIQNTSSDIDGYSFSVVPLGGDVLGNFSKTGNNIQLNISDKSYIFNISAATLSQTDAFSVIPSNDSAYSKTYSLNVNIAALAEDLAVIIRDNPTLYNLWKTLFGIGSSAEIIVDGGCIFQSTSTCNYEFGLSNIPASGTYALLSSITVNDVPVSTNYNFNLSNLTGLQTYLNGLGYGTFNVTNPSGNTVLIVTNSNPNILGGITYKISSTTYLANFNRECTGYTPITLNEFAAYIVNYICQLNDANISTKQGYEVCYIDVLGNKQVTSVPSGTALSQLILEITSRGCTTVDYIKSLGAVNCNSLKSIFDTNSNLQITGTDFLFMTKGGGICSRGSFEDAFLYMLNITKSNATLQNSLCEVIKMCGQGLSCEPFSYSELIVTDYNTVCTEAVGIEYTLN